MAKEVYINGQLCDLNEKDNPIALSYEVNDLAELKDRQAYSTNNFKLPLTQNNRKACGFPDSGSIIQLQPYRNNTAKIIQDGLEVVPNGIAIITGCGQYIEVQILSGLIGFFDMMEGKSIRDLDFSDLEHDWTLSNIIASQSRASGYVWPVIDYGSLSDTDKTVNVLQLRPAVYRLTIIERIVKETGYICEGYPTDNRFLSSILPFSNDKFEHGKSFIDAANTFSASAKSLAAQSFDNDYRTGVITFTDDTATDPGGHWNGTVYTSPATIRVHVRVDYSLDVRDQYKGGSVPEIQIIVQKNGVDIIQNIHNAQGDFVTATYLNQVLEVDVDLVAGDTIGITWHSYPDINRVLGVFYGGSKVSINYAPTDVIYGQPIQLEATLPDISQKDFFKGFLQDFGLIVIPDVYSKKVTLVNMEEVYKNKYKALDLTDKFTDNIIDYDYAFGNYGVANKVKYKDDDNVKDGLGDGSLIFNNLTLKEEVELFTSKFAASESVIKMNGVQVTQIKKIEDPIRSLEMNTKTEPRILINDFQNVSMTFTDGSNNMLVALISLPYFIKTGKVSLAYDELLKEHYPEILRMLYRPLVLKRKINLKASDIANLDFRIPIYDKKTAAYYYNNGITNYITGQECNITLIKMQ